MRKIKFKVILFLFTIIFGLLFPYNPAFAAYYNVFELDRSIQTNSQFGNFACTVTTAQVSNRISATVNIVGDLTGFNRVGWKLSHNSSDDEDTSDVIDLSSTFPKSHTFNTTITGNTVYATSVTFYSDPANRQAIDCFATFTTNPTPPDTQATLLGRVVKNSPDTQSCSENRFGYGNNCGNTNCHGDPNYTITWSQGGNSQITGNNDCSSQGGQNRPRYTFEWTSNPTGDRNGRLINAQINFSDSNVFLTGWGFSVSDSAGNTYPGSNQGSYFSSPGPNQEIQVKVFRDGDFRWNHLWFYYKELNQASCQSISLSKETLYTGEQFTGNISMKNEGTKIWDSGANYRLGSQNPQDNLSWGFNRVNLPYSINPGQGVNFSFNGAAPTTPGTYNFDWQMLQDGVSWFGQKCSAKITVISPPVINSPPNITSLQVTNSNSSQTGGFIGTDKVSGLQSNEGGSNWLNPMNITLNATASGAGNSINKYFVAFYDKKEGTSTIQSAYPNIIDNIANSDPNAQLKTLLNNDHSAGFLLAYDPGSNPPSTGKHYVWDPSLNSSNKWVDITNSLTGYSICGFTSGNKDCINKLYYTVKPINSAPTWWVALFKNFGSKTMYTAGYVLDSNGLSAYQADINP